MPNHQILDITLGTDPDDFDGKKVRGIIGDVDFTFMVVELARKSREVRMESSCGYCHHRESYMATEYYWRTYIPNKMVPKDFHYQFLNRDGYDQTEDSVVSCYGTGKLGKNFEDGFRGYIEQVHDQYGYERFFAFIVVKSIVIKKKRTAA